MESLASIRKLTHKRYVQEKMLPGVIEMIRARKDPMVNILNILENGFIMKFLPDTLNIDPELIPPMFRLRLMLKPSNTVKPEIPTVTGVEAQIDFSEELVNQMEELDVPVNLPPSLIPFAENFKTMLKKELNIPPPENTNNADIDDAMKESKKEYEQNEEMLLNQVIESSLQNTDVPNNDNDNDNLDEILFEQALQESLKNDNFN